MSPPRTLPLDPVDLLGGMLIPEAQTYLVATPPFDLDPGRVRARLAPLITESFGRLGYRFRRRLGTFAGLSLADDPTAPVHVPDVAPADPLAALAPTRPLDDRHWDLTVVGHEGLALVALRFDHLVGHGDLGRRFLVACSDRLRGGDPTTPPRLDPSQSAAFGRLQAALTARAQAAAAWAEYRRLDLGADRVRRLVRAMGLSFSDGLTLWLAYHIQATNRATGHARPLDALGFRMDPATSLEPPLDPALGNAGLLVERWQVDPDGSFERLDRGPADARRGLERFAAFHRAFPVKPLLDAALRQALAAARRRRHAGSDKLVVNNLGPTAYPFFRPIFFDPQNDGDQLGLVYVDGHTIDGHSDQVQLQLTPPRRYLEHFPWDDFERRLHASLADPEGWVAGR